MPLPQESEESPQPHDQSAPPEHAHLITENELCLDLINSVHFDYRGRKEPQDNLDQPEWVKAFSEYWHLPVTSAPNASTLASLRTLRTLMHQMFETLAIGQQITQAQVEQLNAFLAITPMTRQIRRTQSELHLETVTLHTGWDAVLTQIAASWADLLARTPVACLKICANPDCHWAFVDKSQNLSRRWCRQWACGNVMKVRNFRARRSHSA